MNLRTKILLANLMLIASLSAMELPENEEANDSRPAGTTEITELKPEDGAEATTEKGEVTVNEEEQAPTKTGDATAVEEETTPGEGRKETEEHRSALIEELKKMLGINDQEEIALPSIEADDKDLADFLNISLDADGKPSAEDQKKWNLLSEIIDITRKQMTQRELPVESEHEIQTLNGNNTSDDNKKTDDQCDEPEQKRPNCMERVTQFLWNPLEGMKHLFWTARQRISGKMKLN